MGYCPKWPELHVILSGMTRTPKISTTLNTSNLHVHKKGAWWVITPITVVCSLCPFFYYSHVLTFLYTSDWFPVLCCRLKHCLKKCKKDVPTLLIFFIYFTVKKDCKYKLKKIIHIFNNINEELYISINNNKFVDFNHKLNLKLK